MLAVAVTFHPVQQIAAPRATGVLVSTDGRTAYVRSGVGSLGTLRVYRRSGATGKLIQIQCVARAARTCAPGRGLETPAAIALSGRSVYVAARNGRSVGIYDRLADGRLRAAGSVTGLAHPTALAVSPDGRFLYVGGDRIWVFARAAAGGLRLALTVAQSATALAVTSDTLYAGSGGGAHGILVAYARDVATGALTETARVDSATTPGIQQPAQIAVARGSVYVASTVSGAVTRFDSALRPTGIARGLPRAFGLAVTDRVAVAYRDGVAAFSLALAPAGRTPLAGATGVAAYGRFVYAVAPGRVSVLAR